jgi:hypothetical protein
MDGIDAVEFFKEFGEEFKVNLEDLGSHWDQHFGPEGIPISVSLVFIVVIWICITAGFWLRDSVGVLPAWAWGFGLIAIAVLIWYWRVGNTIVPITVGDLVESARSGRWSKSYTKAL